MEKNLTTGNVFKNVLVFSLPYLLSYFLQTLYGMADLFIIGQFDGVSGTTAVSIGSQVMHMLTVMIVGLAMGATVSIGQAVGARQKEQAAAYIGNTITLFMGLSVVLTCILLIANRSIVSVMSTPEAAVEGTVAYLTICFLGIPFITAYNIISPFPGHGGQQKPHVFYRGSLRCQHCIGLSLYGSPAPGTRRSSAGNHLCPGNQRGSVHDFYPQAKVRHFPDPEGLKAPEECDGTDSPHRDSHYTSGWFYPDFFHYNNHHCQPPWIK